MSATQDSHPPYTMQADGKGRAAVLLTIADYSQIHLPLSALTFYFLKGGVFPLPLINGKDSKKRVLKQFKIVYHVKLNPHNKADGV